MTRNSSGKDLDGKCNRYDVSVKKYKICVLCSHKISNFILFDTLNTEDEIKWCEYTFMGVRGVRDCGNCIAMEQSDYIIIINR